MNIFIFTSRIVSLPRLYFDKKKVCIYMILCLRNSKKSRLWYNIKTFGRGKISNYIFDMYKKGDFVTIEGSIKVQLQKESSIRSNYQKNNKLVYIKINKIYPARYVFK
uniref:hypothetical protein n=1 Tax=Catenella fusiformis TaxID=3024791 RepID=UPI0027DAA962|nr:hypothetical protein REQ04_pgp118 [Catenella fusiformis]WCH57509.1 hypothetical protein [Catenella fusiformis]